MSFVYWASEHTLNSCWTHSIYFTANLTNGTQYHWIITTFKVRHCFCPVADNELPNWPDLDWSYGLHESVFFHVFSCYFTTLLKSSAFLVNRAAMDLRVDSSVYWCCSMPGEINQVCPTRIYFGRSLMSAVVEHTHTYNIFFFTLIYVNVNLRLWNKGDFISREMFLCKRRFYNMYNIESIFLILVILNYMRGDETKMNTVQVC